MAAPHLPDYAELHCVSNFSFLRGASHPAELVERAHELGYSALAVTDECSLAGVVRAHQQATINELPLIIGAEFSLRDAFGDDESRLVLLATNRDGYGNLSELISRARMRAAKGTYRLLREDLAEGVDDCLALLIAGPAIAVDPIGSEAHESTPSDRLLQQARFFRERFDGRCWLGVPLLLRGHDTALLERSAHIAELAGLPRVACGDVHYHVRSRKTLQDTMTAIRLRKPVRELGFALSSNAEQHLRSRARLARLYPRELLDETLRVAERCRFSLDSLRYEYPDEIVPKGHTATTWLRELTEQGLKRRYPNGTPAKVRQQVEYELKLIADLEFEPYFLTVADIVAFARRENILCQGRGSAANSTVCYCLGITEVDPERTSLLFERFISRERKEPPDIDVDFEHQRREEVIQYLYEKYGRERAALTATVICYRSRSALRDVGRALGIDAQRIDQVASSHQWWDGLQGEALREAGFDPDSTLARQWLALAATLRNFPRHLSQHTGGFVLARGLLTRLVPVENATMDERSVIQWDKDDLDALRLLKVDVLALGMLSAIRRALEMISRRRGSEFRMQDIPEGDHDTYAMISRADTIGVFQIESRAQMSMLPRLRPKSYYDLVVEVAIVRPGPIQGGMVHPYLQRRQLSPDAITYANDELKPALERTLGIPIFQEQVMQIAMIAAEFTPGEADELRRSMAAWRRKGGLDRFRDRLIGRMIERKYPREFAEAIFRQIEGFGEYGFPESHAASFALLVYVSSWIKRHEPAVFLAALLNSQPMGFYAPAQLVRDAREHGVEVRGVDVLISDEHSTLEEQPGIGPYRPPGGRHSADARPIDVEPTNAGSADKRPQPIDARPQPAVRLGLRQVRGLSPPAIARIVAAREQRRRERGSAPPFDDVEDLARLARLEAHDLQCLARSNALRALAGHRRQAHWQVAGITPLPALLAEARFDETPLELAAPSEAQEITADYRSLGLPMGRHPLALLRSRLARHDILTARALQALPSNRGTRASGLVTHRQRPETAKGTIFVTLEDETGAINIIVWPKVFERYRREVLGAQLMTVFGVWQRDEASGEVRHLVARRIFDHSALLGQIEVRSRDFH